MENLLGASLSVFVGVTLLLFGGASWLMGHALAGTWRPIWQAFIYGTLLGAVDRFFIFALFEGELLAPGPFVLHTLVLIAIALAAYRLTRARRMVSQYPWLYERAGPFAWRPCRRESRPGDATAEEELPPNR